MDLGVLCDTIGRVDRTVDDVVDELFDATDTELDERVRALELLRRRVEAETALTLATVEQRRLYLADGHRSVKGYLRATCNSSNPDIAAARRLAKAADGVPGVAEALQAGRIGVARQQPSPACTATHGCVTASSSSRRCCSSSPSGTATTTSSSPCIASRCSPTPTARIAPATPGSTDAMCT